MKKCIPLAAVLFAVLILIPKLHAQPLVTIETVTVGDAGNAADTTGYGAAADVFAIGKYEVTIGQYTTFLNSVAAVTSDTYIVNLWNANMTSNLNIAGISRSGSGILGDPYSYSVLGSGSRPITDVSWFDAARFANWMNNGATNGASTETGAYTLNGATSGVGFTKNAGATWWIPSEDEWYKAAYYKGGGTNAGYWVYPTQSDSAPGNNIGGAANQANYYAGDYAVTQSPDYSDTQNYLTEAGVFSNSASAYGTFDQAGNVWEWNDAVIGSYRGIRGGSWIAGDNDENLQSSSRSGIFPSFVSYSVGFRVATVPEPSIYALLALAAAGLGAHVLRRRRKLAVAGSRHEQREIFPSTVSVRSLHSDGQQRGIKAQLISSRLCGGEDTYRTVLFPVRSFLGVCAFLLAIDAAAQTFPPANPFMGPPGTATMHANAASTGATMNPGPGSGPVSIINTNYGAVFPTILMGSDGLIVSVATRLENRTPYVHLLDPTTLESLATPLELVRSSTSELAGGIYSYLDNNDRLVLVNANGFLQRISHTQSAGGSWSLNVESSVQIGYPDVVGLVPDYQGRVWFATAQGTSAGSGAVVGYYDPATAQTAHFTLPAGEQVANSISSSPAGVAVASTAALYMFNAGTSAPEQLWRETYDAGPARKPGQLSWGTGATPAFFGPDTGYEYLTITDNAAPQENILVYQTSSGDLVGSVPFLTAGVNSGNEDAAIAVGNSIYYPSTYGYPYPPSAESGPSDPASAPFVGGMQRVDVLPDGTLQTVWSNNTIASAAEPRLSVLDNLIYTMSVDTNTGVYSVTTIDPDTGAVLSSTPYGSSAGDNPLQMVSMISPDGILYQGTERGLIRVEAIPEPSTYALLALGAAALGAHFLRRRK